jgi:uncharacterized protein YodC (DUF2158 family)
MAHSFQVGDVVMLKSGSDHMTITHLSTEGAALAWYLQGEIKKTSVGSWVPLAALVPVPLPTQTSRVYGSQNT